MLIYPVRLHFILSYGSIPESSTLLSEAFLFKPFRAVAYRALSCSELDSHINSVPLASPSLMIELSCRGSPFFDRTGGSLSHAHPLCPIITRLLLHIACAEPGTAFGILIEEHFL